MKARFRYLLLLISFSARFLAQDFLYSSNGAGLNLSANFAFGTHFQRLGLNVNFFYVHQSFQFNSEARCFFSFKNLGPAKIYTETVLSQGVVYAYGKTSAYGNPFLSSVSNQTGLNHSLGYSYNFYINKIHTSQVTGIVSLQFNNVSFITENDILARPILDRFRTGATLIQYHYKDVFQAGINCTMWTGKLGRTVQNDKFPNGCYMDTTGGIYTNYSHGLLSAQFRYHIGGGHNIQANAGVDAEQVRNVLQNKIIHDVAFIPKTWFRRNNCHIPMLDEKGDQYLFQAEQKIKKPRLYWNLFGNPNLFY